MKIRALVGAALVALLAAAWFGVRAPGHVPQAKTARPAPKLAVEVATASEQAVPFLWHALGSVEPYHSVAIRPQVTGVLQEVAFGEGERVKQGQLLFRIDPAPLAAAVTQAKAQLAKDEATLANARWQERRQKELQGKKYGSEQDYQNAKALVAETEAAVALDRAALQQAEIRLGHTEIRAPIDGYTGALSVKAGNLVDASQSTPLVTINQVSPALVRFTVPQSELETVRTARRGGRDPQVRLQNGASGELVFIDNTLDTKTGTIVLKARFPNTDAVLWPGQFVPLDLISGIEPNALVIPETALQQGQNGPFVYQVVDGKVHVQPVRAGRQVGNRIVIESGLPARALVVSRVPRRLEDGVAVIVRRSDGGQ